MTALEFKTLRDGTELDEKGESLGEAICEFDVRVPLKPVVELGDYKALKAEKPSIDVTDQEVEAQIETMRARRGGRRNDG